jgi:hypothetical protein
MLLRDGLGGGVDGLAAVQCNGHERDIDGRRHSEQRPYLDLAFEARLYVVSASAKSLLQQRVLSQSDNDVMRASFNDGASLGDVPVWLICQDSPPGSYCLAGRRP